MPADPASAPSRVEYETRLVDGLGKSAPKILPYVLDALAALGAGSAVAVGNDAIQITVPIVLMQNLAATIKDLAKAGPEEYPENVFYRPAIPAANPEELASLVASLGMCPPDMRVQWAATDAPAGPGKPVEGCVLFAGPRDREDYYKKKILKAVNVLAGTFRPA